MSSKQVIILLTGGAGFIGSHVAEALLRRKSRLVIIDNLDSFYSPEQKKANLAEIQHAGMYTFWNVDICQFEKLTEAIDSCRPDAIIHLAARAGVRSSIEQPELYQRVNVVGTRNLLKLAHKFKVKKFVFGSSSSVYGETPRIPFSEDDLELKPISPYAATKLSCERLCQTYSRAHGLSIIALRFFSVYGPRQRPDQVIHKFMALLEAGKPLPIFGDGTAGRDYTYVDDIVRGVLAALDYELQQDASGGSYRVFNLGSSSPVPVIELVKILERVTGRTAVLKHMKTQTGDPPVTWAELSKSAQFLGYVPAVPLEEGLARFCEWYRSKGAQHGSMISR